MVVFTSFFHKITAFNQDLGRHLKLGQIITETKKVPRKNLFSYTHPDFPFINHHWLSEVIFYLFENFLGVQSLVFLKTIILSSCFFILFVDISRKYTLKSAFLTSLPILILISQRNAIRPEIFSYLFLSVYLIILSKNHLSNKHFLILAFIQLFWVNSHIYFFLGPVMLFFHTIISIFIEISNSQKQKLKKIISGKIDDFLWFGIISAINLINPNLIKGALYPLNVFKNYGYSIIENKSLFFLWRYFNRPYNSQFLIIFSISFLFFLSVFKKLTSFEKLLFIFTAGFSFYAVRNIPIFALSSFSIISKTVFLNKQRLIKKLNQTQRINFKIFFYVLFIFLNLSLIIKNTSSKNFGLGTITGPQQAVQFIKEKGIQGPVFNNFDIGSFLIYQLYPQQKVFVDGRPEAYPADFFKNTYIKMQDRPQKFQQINKKYNFNYIFFSHRDITPWAKNFMKNISDNPDWKLAYSDHFALIFLKNSNYKNEK